MGIYPAPTTCFVPENLKDCDHIQLPALVVPGHRMGIERYFRAGTSDLVAFAAWHSVDVENTWHEVWRIDSWHGSVHQHQYFQTAKPEITELAPIPTRQAASVIDVWSSKAELIMQNEWEEHFRRWTSDGE